MTLEEMVKDQLKEEFESVVGKQIPEDDSNLQIVIGSRGFNTLDELTYYLSNRMWDSFDEELTRVEVE